MKLSDFNYYLPEKLIAQVPLTPRDHSRLLVVRRKPYSLEHRHFFNIVDYFSQGDVLILNDSKVIPARLLGRKISGGRVEVFLIHKIKVFSKTETWECLIKGKRLKAGDLIIVAPSFQGVIKEKINDVWLVNFNCGGKKFQKALHRFGKTPLPPYIKSSGKTYQQKYQTVYANAHKAGSVAAPTAGLHFTPRLLKKLRQRGVIIKTITLHIGLGTFLPIRVDTIKKHQMHSEWVEVPTETMKAISYAHQHGSKVIAVGTTVTRALEAAYQKNKYRDFSGWVNIFIYPPYRFRVIDGLITNFHLPQSSLLLLVSALVGRKKLLALYEVAIKEQYRFFSFGDAMLIK